jgi:hypothetical protein
MGKTVFEDNEYGTMWYYPEDKIVHHQYKKFMSGDVFHNFLLKGTEAMKKFGLTKWLSDDRENPVLTTEDIKWGETNWFPQTLQAGWKYWAIVQPKAAIAKMNTDKIVEQYGKAGIVAKYFTDPDEAYRWLVDQG